MATTGPDSAQPPSIWRPLLTADGDTAPWSPLGLLALAAGLLVVAILTPPREPSVTELPSFAPLITYAATYPTTPMPAACAALIGGDPSSSADKRAQAEAARGDPAELLRRCEALRLQLAQSGRTGLALTVARGPMQPGWLSASALLPGGLAWMWAGWMAFLLTPTLLSRLGGRRLAGVVIGGALGGALGAYSLGDDALQPIQLGGLLPVILGAAFALGAGNERLRLAGIFGAHWPAQWVGLSATLLSPWAPALVSIIWVAAGFGVSASLSARLGALGGATALAWVLSARQGAAISASAPSAALSEPPATLVGRQPLPEAASPTTSAAAPAAVAASPPSAPGAADVASLGPAAPAQWDPGAAGAAPPAPHSATPITAEGAAMTDAPAAAGFAAPAGSTPNDAPGDSASHRPPQQGGDADLHSLLDAVAAQPPTAAATPIGQRAAVAPSRAPPPPAAPIAPAEPEARAIGPQRGDRPAPYAQQAADAASRAPAAAETGPRDAPTVALRHSASSGNAPPTRNAASSGSIVASVSAAPGPAALGRGASVSAIELQTAASTRPAASKLRGELTERVDAPERQGFALRSAVGTALPVADGTQAYEPAAVADARAQIGIRRSSPSLARGASPTAPTSVREALAQAPRRDVHLRERTTAGLMLVLSDGREVHLRPHEVRAIHAGVCDSLGPEPVLDLYVHHEGALERWHLPWRGIHRARLLAGAAPQLAWATLSVELAGAQALRLPRGNTWPPQLLPRYVDEDAMAAAALGELDAEASLLASAPQATADGAVDP